MTATSRYFRLTRVLIVTAALGALAACGGNKERPKADLAASQVTTIGVNAYLWRAALETVRCAMRVEVPRGARGMTGAVPTTC